MKGTPHEIYLDSTTGDGVAICNDQDDFYACVFETRNEVSRFLEQLRQAADKKWPINDGLGQKETA